MQLYCNQIILLILNIQCFLSQSPPFFEWEYSIWTKHNELRSKVARGLLSDYNQPFSNNMEEILYDTNLQTIPLNHALNCNFSYNKNLQRQADAIQDILSFNFSKLDQFGENIAWDSSGPLLTFDRLQKIIQTQWFDNIYPYYDYYNSQCLFNSSLYDNINCNLYEKLLWAKTRYMACGVSICPSLPLNDKDNTIVNNAAFIVCNYWPSFDKDELPIYNTTQISVENVTHNNDDDDDDDDDNNNLLCSQCPSDRSTQCIKGLCSGCPAPNFNYCQDRIIVCDSLIDKCNSDPIAQLYCPFTCNCNQNDLIPDEKCHDLYLNLPTSQPTEIPTTLPTLNNDECDRLGWYDVEMLENDQNIKCRQGYSLPIIDSIDYVIDMCLNNEDINMINHELPITKIKPYGIAIDWIKYQVGCDWNSNYDKGVIVTHTGIKCGDREQLFICIPNQINTLLPTMTYHPTTNLPTTSTEITTSTVFMIPSLDTMDPTMTDSTGTTSTTSEPTWSEPASTEQKTTTQPITDTPTSMEPSYNPSDIPTTSKPTQSPTFKPSMSPTLLPTAEPTDIDYTEPPSNAPTSGPTFSPSEEPTQQPTHQPSISPTYLPSDNPTFQTTLTIDIPVTTSKMDYQPFRMFLVFPHQLTDTNNNNNNINNGGNIINSRRLVSSLSSSNHEDIALYPLNARYLSLPMGNNKGFGYQFKLRKPLLTSVKHRNVGLSKILYTVDTQSCDIKKINSSMIRFKLLSMSDNDEWIEIEAIKYNPKLYDKNQALTNIIIDIENNILLDFDTLYLFIIDIIAFNGECINLLHPVYARSYGDFYITRHDLMINEINPVMSSNDNNKFKVNLYKYWMNISISFQTF